MADDDKSIDPYDMVTKKKDQDIEALTIKELFRYRILFAFHGTQFLKLNSYFV